MNLRVGHGFDIHPLVLGRRLKVGGVLIPHTHGLQGHSDADVLLHALCDALLGSAGLNDIGTLFPSENQDFKDADSLSLLSRVHGEIQAAGVVEIINVDCCLMAEAPKFNPYIPRMKTAIAQALHLTTGRIGIKATTMEKLGAIGRQEGIAASAIVLVRLNE